MAMRPTGGDPTLPQIASLHAAFGDFGAARHGDTDHSGVLQFEAPNPLSDPKDPQ
jgi:hypothetical protein